jgi:predicted transcriptional regulator
MAQVNVRLDEATREVLRRLAVQEGRSMQAVLAAAVEDYRRRKILEAANAGYAELRADADEWKAVLAERETWDAAVADGLRGPERFRGPRSVVTAREGGAKPSKKRGGTSRSSDEGGKPHSSRASRSTRERGR